MPYEWTPDLSVGTEDIDAQHRELLGRIRELHRCMHAGETGSVPDVLAGVRAYAESHFATEEREMRRVRYPQLEPHAAQHSYFAAQLAAFERDWARRGTTPTLAVDLAGWLSGWFREHIRGFDRELGAFLRASRPGGR